MIDSHEARSTLMDRLAEMWPLRGRGQQFKPAFRYGRRDLLALRTSVVLRLLWHRVFATDRRRLIGRGYRVIGTPSQMQKLNAALYDAMYSLLLYGYSQISGLAVSQDTASFLCLLRNLISQVDEVFEEQSKRGASVALLDIFQHPLVAAEDLRVREFLLAHNRARDVRDFLRDTFEHYNERYANLATISGADLSWDECLALIDIDSGMQLLALMEAIRLFNDHPANERLQQEFYALGIAGKVADDLVDLERDVRNGDPNLAYAAARDYPAERAAIEAAVAAHADMARPWWLRYAPHTFSRCLEILYAHYDRIEAPALQLACRLMWLPTVWPLNYDKYRLRS